MGRSAAILLGAGRWSSLELEKYDIFASPMDVCCVLLFMPVESLAYVTVSFVFVIWHLCASGNLHLAGARARNNIWSSANEIHSEDSFAATRVKFHSRQKQRPASRLASWLAGWLPVYLAHDRPIDKPQNHNCDALNPIQTLVGLQVSGLDLHH